MRRKLAILAIAMTLPAILRPPKPVFAASPAMNVMVAETGPVALSKFLIAE